MGRTAPRSGPCLAPHLPPAPPLQPAIPAGRSPPWRSDHRSRRHPRQPLSPPSGRPPHRLACLFSRHTSLRAPFLSSSTFFPCSLRRRSGTGPPSPPTGTSRPPSGSSPPFAPFRTDVPEDRHSHPLRSCLQERPSCQANPTSTSARAASRPGFPLQSPLRSDFRSNPSRLRSLRSLRAPLAENPAPPPRAARRPVLGLFSGPRRRGRRRPPGRHHSVPRHRPRAQSPRPPPSAALPGPDGPTARAPARGHGHR